MSKHTPGPWLVITDHSGYPHQIHAPNGDDRKPGAVGSSVTRWGAISLPSSDEGKANARLIAAAPELLEALRAYVEPQYEGGTDNDAALLRRARAAIAKATGEQA